MAVATAASNGRATEAPPVAAAETIQLDRLAAETITVPIRGTTPLIVHRFSEKARRAMLDQQQGRKTPKAIRDPQADYEASRYRLSSGGDGFPVLAFKDATVSGARFYGKTVTMTSLRQCLFFGGEPSADGRDLLVPIDGEPRFREDYVRINNGRGTDLRFRAEFPQWSATLAVTYVVNLIARNSVLSLIDAGGMGVGVGDWRPEKGGQNGTYGIDTSRNVEVAR